MVRVRFAPSPTGMLHIGGVRTALYNQLFARRHGGVFVVRIEDTDKARFVEGGIENILRTLAAVGLAPDEGPYIAEDGSLQQRGDFGPYIQSQRHDIHMEHAKTLLANGNAYHCFCTAERLEEMKKQQAAMKQQIMYDGLCRALPREDAEKRVAAGESHVIRFAMPKGDTLKFTDLIRGEVSFESSLLDDLVLVKSDGFAAFPLANIVDDHTMGITHVIRAEEWFPSTPKHIYIHRAFGWKEPEFAHVPLMLNPDRSKLSKRQGDVATEDYLAKGYLPEALINFLALQGWNPRGDQEIYTKDELIAEFDLGKVNKGGAVFNREKLDWFNHEYLKVMPVETLWERAKPFFMAAGISTDGVGEATILKALTIEQGRVNTLAELPSILSYFFDKDTEYGLNPAHLVWKKSDATTAKSRLEGLIAFLTAQPTELFDDKSALEAALIDHIKTNGWSNGDTLWPMRVALSGREASPSPFEIAWVLGKERTLIRLQHALAELAKIG